MENISTGYMVVVMTEKHIKSPMMMGNVGNSLEDFIHLFCCMKYDWVLQRLLCKQLGQCALDTQSNKKKMVIQNE